MSDQNKSALIELMHAKYMAILPVEAEWGIRLHEGDMRPRIEHFHDAVRALTSGSDSQYEKNSRLSVENLAYDLSQLRAIGDRPLGYINRANAKSTSSALVKMGEAGASPPRMPPQPVRAQLIREYADYTVFYAALFAEAADRNFQSRSDAVDGTVADVGLIEQVVKQLMAGKMTNAQATDELMHVERDDLRERLQAMLAKKNMSAKEKQEVLALIAQIEKGLDTEKKRLDQAHLSYATGQLAVYEESKETIKRMAAQGLNLAGKFVEQAVSRAQGQGRER